MTPRKPRILIIDDDTDYVEFIRVPFARAGLEVESAADGDEGLSKLDVFIPDLVLVDYKMPRLSGERFVIEARNRVKGLPIAVISNYSDMAATQEFFLKIGARQVFSKSIRISDLIDGVEEILRSEGWEV